MCWTSQRARPNSYRFMKSPITRSCICSVLEKHSVRRTNRLMRVRRLMCLLSIFWVFSFPGTGSVKCPDTFTSNFSGRHGWRESCSSSAVPSYCQGETMTLTHIRCPYCHGKNVEEQSTYTIKCGAPRTMYYCSSCERSFSETRSTPIAHLKTPIALVVQVLTALTEGVGINAATRLYGVSKNSIYRWQERLSGLKKRCCCLL